MEIRNRVFEEEAVLFWEKERAGTDTEYEVLQNGTLIGRCRKTHFTVSGLTPDTEYEFQVRVLYREKNQDNEKEDNEKDTEETYRETYEETGSLRIRTEPQKNILDVTKAPYFAKGDGKTLNTAALQRALDDCTPTDKVLLPEGIFLTGALRVHSNTELYLEKGAVLQGTDRVEDYLPKIKSRFEGTELECYSSVLNLGELNHEEGCNCENVILRGEGTIASGGRLLAERVIETEKVRLKEVLEQMGDAIKEYEKPETLPGRVRPRLIHICNSKNVTMRGLTFKDGASWNVHMIYSQDIVTSHCSFTSEGVWNGDGWDPDSSENCTIFDCAFFTGDDSVAIKSGKNPEGNQINRPSRRIRIFDCACAFGHGITIGSEMSGGVSDVKIWDCDLSRSKFGIEIKGTKKRGGYVRDVEVTDTSVSRILFHSVGYNDDGIGAPNPPLFSDCAFRNLSVAGRFLEGYEQEWQDCDAIELQGFDRAGYELRNIEFSDLTIGYEGQEKGRTISLRYCENVTFRNVKCM